ncbi:hypothetical protein [Occultella kanbiaonis]|nr:hypothetical protein [Occultella kanbiaonis]
MDIARVLEDDQPISIGDYLRLPPTERPILLQCAGTLRTGIRVRASS